MHKAFDAYYYDKDIAWAIYNIDADIFENRYLNFDVSFKRRIIYRYYSRLHKIVFDLSFGPLDSHNIHLLISENYDFNNDGKTVLVYYREFQTIEEYEEFVFMEQLKYG